MSNNPFLNNWLKMDISNKLPGFGAPMDLTEMMESGRKTIRAFTQAQQVAMESLQVIAQRQGEIISQFVQDQSEIAKDIINEGTPEEKIARSAERLRQSYEKSINNSREMADMLGKSAREASDIINNRVTSALDELKTTVVENQPAAKSGKASKAA